MIYKIDPLVPYFPVCEGATREQLTEIRSLYEQLKVEDASKKAEELTLGNDEQSQLTRLRMAHWKAKALYLRGDCAKSLECVEELVDGLMK